MEIMKGAKLLVNNGINLRIVKFSNEHDENFYRLFFFGENNWQPSEYKTFPESEFNQLMFNGKSGADLGEFNYTSI